jgi:hypothetical protein
MTMHLASLGAGKKTSGTTTLVHDAFNTAANGTVLSGETPTTGPTPHPVFNPDGTGEFFILNGTADPGGNQFPCDIYQSLGQSDVTMTSFAHWNGDCDLTFILRFQDVNNYWSASYDPGSETLYLIETLAASNTTRATSVASGHTSGSYTFSSQTSGTTLSANMDSGAATVSYSSSDLQSAQSFGIAAAFNFGAASGGDAFGPLIITHP